MSSFRTLRSIAPLVALGLALLAGQADAGEQARRLQIQIDYQRDGAVSAGAESGRGRLAQQLVLSAVLHSDGVAMPNNPLDPEDGKRQLERAQRSQQKVQAAQAKVGRPPAAAPDMAAMQARAQQLMAKCGQDRECLMREASAMSAAQVAGGDKATRARLEAYGRDAAACERQATAKAREACQADVRRRHGGGEDEPDDEVETPYLMFTGRTDCRLETAVKIDGRVDGSFQDVQGTVPYTETVQAQQKRREQTACPLLQVVLDQRNGRVWTYAAMVDTRAAGVSTRQEKGRALQRHEGPVELRWMEAGPWLEKRVTNLTARGEDRLRQPLAGGGQVELTLRWSFEPA